MRILVCGGRDYDDRQNVFDMLDVFNARNNLGVTLVIHGGANGADKLAHLWACARGLRISSYPADWQKYGKRAGPIRNRQMLTEGKPDAVIVFPGGKGTQDMMSAAIAAKVPVWHTIGLVRWGEQPTSAGFSLSPTAPL